MPTTTTTRTHPLDYLRSRPYGIVTREGNTNADGAGVSSGIMGGPEDYEGHVTFYVKVPDAKEALVSAERLGGTRMMGPDKVMDGLIIGLFQDAEGHTIGVLSEE